MESSSGSKRKFTMSAPSGKLAFSLKPKSKLIAPPVKFGGDDEEDEVEVGSSIDRSAKKHKGMQSNMLEQPSKSADVAPSAPSDPTVKKVADKLASFVAKNGRQFEHVTREKNPGDTPFKFLFDESCAVYKYYEYRLNEEERAMSRTSYSGSTDKPDQAADAYQSAHHQMATYQIPASALYEPTDSVAPVAPSSSNPVAMMEFYMKKAAQEEKRKRPKQSKDEMPPPASLQAMSDKKGHHMGDYIPPEELEKFMSACSDAAAQKATKEAIERAKIQADNVGHKLLSKMGWREGEGLGSSKNGIANPIMAGNVKKDTLGVGASQPGEVTPDDDIYEQYKKRMMLGYRHRPNPLGNPRKAYY